MDGLECSEVYRSDLERTARIDAEFYRKENLVLSTCLNRKELKPFTECFSVSDGNHMSISSAFCDKGVPYYRGQDIHNVFIEEASPVFIDYETFWHPHMLRSHLKRGDVLLSIVGTIGSSAIVSLNEEATCSCKLAILRNKEASVCSEILFIFIKTKYGQNQIQKFKRGAVQMGLLLEDFDQLWVPQFSEAFQKYIAQVVSAAHKTMMEGNRIYNFTKKRLLEEIGFDFSDTDPSNNIVKNFSASFGSSGRLDAEYYRPKYDRLFALLDGLTTKPLGAIVDITKSIEPGSEYYGKEGIPFIRVSDVSARGMDTPAVRIPKRTVPSIETLYPKKDTILFSKDGSVGIAYKVEEDMEAVTSGALLHLRIKNVNEVLPDYLTLVLNSQIVQLQAERDASGAIIQHWKPGDIENVVIPILPYAVQREIAEKVQKSFSLRREAESLIELAVQAVETAIEKGEAAAAAFLEEKERSADAASI